MELVIFNYIYIPIYKLYIHLIEVEFFFSHFIKIQNYYLKLSKI